MIGAVMLLMAATVGITYGWTPDGGDGVKYIIQIPPDKMEQVARSGEISSQIPPEIRGHVSEVVIRVGQGNVPRITPTYVSSRGAGSPNAVAAADQIPMPIPSMGNPMELRPIGTTDSGPTAMMKPAPQSGGMNMPGGFGMTPAATSNSTAPANTGYGSTGYAGAPPTSTGYNSASLEQAAREAADNLGKQYNAATDASRQQIQQNIDAAARRMGDAANAQVQSATNGLQNAANEMIYGPAGPSSTMDDPRTRLTQSNSAAQPPMTSTSATSGPSTSPYAASTSSQVGYGSAPTTSATATSSGFGTAPSFATTPPVTRSQSTSSPSPSAGSANITNSRTVSTPPLNATTHDEQWYALNNGPGSRPSTAPVGRSGGAFTGGNFGQLPGGLQPSVNSSSNQTSQPNYTASGYADGSGRTASANSDLNNDLNYDPQLSPAQAARLPKNGYSYDAEGYPVDSRGYRLNLYGQRVDRQGNLLTAVNAMGAADTASGTSNTNPRGGSGYAYGRPQENFERNSSMPPLVHPPRNQPNASGRDLDGVASDSDSRFAGLNDRNGNGSRQSGNVGWNDGRSRPAEDNLPSASDGQSRQNRLDEKEKVASGVSGLGELERDTEQVAAQPIFNALLLLSVVANIYLLFWLRNMREQFRDIVAAKRASSSGGSLATGV